MRVVVVFSFLGVLGSACQPVPAGSGLDHVFGRTQRAAPATLRGCQVESTDVPALHMAGRYLTNVAEFIMKKNPDTFQGAYAPEKFCVSVQESPAVNAYALVHSREIVFFTGLLEVLPTDSHVAAVMAHELAHVTMQHDDEQEADEINQDARWQTEGAALKKQLVVLGGEQGGLDQTQETIYSDQESIEAALNAAQSQSLRDAKAAVEALFDTISAELNPLIMSRQDDYLAFWNLGMLLAAPVPRFNLESPPYPIAATTSSPEFEALRVKVEGYLEKRAAWIAAEEKASPDLAERYRALIARSNDLRTRYAAIYDEREKIAGALYDLRKSILGSATENWREEEADEVGLELYLRAGLAPLNYQGMFESLSSQEQENVAACALQIASAPPERGNESHPSLCWRYYNAKVLEMQTHATFYEPLVAKATQVTLFPGQLEDLKKGLTALSGEAP